jgi:hypothetical protein
MFGQKFFSIDKIIDKRNKERSFTVNLSFLTSYRPRYQTLVSFLKS